VVFALFPAWKLSKPDVWIDLKESAKEDTSGRRRLFSRRNLLVMAQLSLSLMMLCAAGLFIHSAVRAANIQPGFSLDNELLAETDASLINYDEARATRIYSTVKDRLRQIPGVQSVAIGATVPFGVVRNGKSITPAGAAASKEHPALSASYNVVSDDYFQTLGIPVLRGRQFTAAETTPGSKSTSVIIDQFAADKLWPHEDPLGKHIRTSEESKQGTDFEVVGVVGNTQDGIIGEKLGPHLYAPFGGAYQADVHFHVKFAGRGADAESRILEAMRREIFAADPALPLLALKTMRGHLDAGFDLWIVRTGAHMLEIFGSAALLLAVIGLYALNAYTVSRRTREIGIRMALGADSSSTMRMILGEALKVTMVGVGVGLLLAIGIGKLLASMLYDISSFDPLVLSSAPIVLTLVAIFACYVPARRAARVDPLIALRYE